MASDSSKTECGACGSIHFSLTERYSWSCEIDGDGRLGCTNPDAQIDEICCAECGATYRDADFASIDFN